MLEAGLLFALLSVEGYTILKWQVVNMSPRTSRISFTQTNPVEDSNFEEVPEIRIVYLHK